MATDVRALLADLCRLRKEWKLGASKDHARRDDGCPLMIWPQEHGEWLQGRNAAGEFMDEMNAAGLQVQLTTYPPTGEEHSRPVVILFTDSNGERFFVDPDREAIYGDTPEEAITRAYVEWLTEVQRG